MNNETTQILKGQIVYTKTQNELTVCADGYLVARDGKVVGVFDKLCEEYKDVPVEDYKDRLIIPGLVDLHVHAPQYAFRGTGMDLELLDWLNTYTFPEEAKYKDMEYAKRAYSLFVNDLKNGATTRAVVFATIHTEATLMLMDMLNESGLGAMVGKVNMDRNSPDILRETTQESLQATRAFIAACKDYKRVKPMLTPRFTPSCTDELMQGLGEIQRETGLAVQSHLSENPSEIAWVKDLCPASSCYADTYKRCGLFGDGVPTVMAHGVYPSATEMDMIAKNKVFIAHCPQSNANLASGIAPIREYMENGVKLGIGTDIAGGASLSMMRAVADTISVSKLRWRLVDESRKPLSVSEAFFMATKGGGELFGKVGSFEEGYAFDAIVLSDDAYKSVYPMSIEDRLERAIYLAHDSAVLAKYVDGVKIK